MSKVVPNGNLHTLRGRIPNVCMGSKNDGGVHLMVSGVSFKLADGKDSVSVHLTKEQTILLAKELIYRVYKHTLSELQMLMQIGDD